MSWNMRAEDAAPFLKPVLGSGIPMFVPASPQFLAPRLPGIPGSEPFPAFLGRQRAGPLMAGWPSPGTPGHIMAAPSIHGIEMLRHTPKVQLPPWLNAGVDWLLPQGDDVV